MLPKLFSSSLGSYLATLTVVLGFLSQITQALDRKKVTEVFKVKEGTENGGCDNHLIDVWFDEAFDLANHVDECLKAAQNALEEKDLEHDSLQYLKTFFNLNPKEEADFNSHFEKMRGKYFHNQSLRIILL